jgi:ribonuclease VapC
LIVVDTSALVAILEGEPDADDLAALLFADDESRIASATYLEACIVRGGRAGRAGLGDLDGLLDGFSITIVDTSAHQARLAREAFLRFGKGLHPAALNFGDCFAYALAKELDAPLLFKGDDFARTDIRPALKMR